MHKKRSFTWLYNVANLKDHRRLIMWLKKKLFKNYTAKGSDNGKEEAVLISTNDDFRIKYGCINRKIVLGVAFAWGERKGMDVFVALSKRLTEDYQIVLVGTNDDLDKQLPENIISIHRTQNQFELAQIYSTADVFVNPTREDTFPTVNMEALACGTPVVTFDTGGCPECIDDSCGIVVRCDDIDAMETAVRNACEKRPFSREACVARAKHFDKHEKFQEYIQLYKKSVKSMSEDESI